MSTTELDLSNVVSTIDITVLRKTISDKAKTIYFVRTGDDEHYLAIKGVKDPNFKPNYDYTIDVANNPDNKTIYATIPLNYIELNDNLPVEYEAEIIDGNDIQRQPSLYRGRAELPSIKEIDQQIERYEYVKNKLITDDDQLIIGNKKYTTKSGWRKFINAFGLSIELIDKRVFEADDIKVNRKTKEETIIKNVKHAEVRVRAIAPNGQSVEGIGIKSMSNVFGDKSLHNLVATAWTKAVNRAVSDLVAYGAVSAEEIKDGDA